jgi:hypothetical protein
MSLPPHLYANIDDTTLVKLAREVAMNIFDIETILTRYKIDQETWLWVQEHPRFAQLLTSAIEEWESALNTKERVKVKASSMIELWLAHANELLHNTNEDTGKKTELAKFVARLADLGVTNTQIQGNTGERLSVIINLGSDQLKIEKDITPKVIEHDSSQA